MRHNKLLYIIGGAALSAALIACGGNNSKNNNTAAPAANATATARTAATPAAATSAQPTAARTAAPSASPTQAAANIRRGGTLSLAIQADPKTFDPMLASDQFSTYVTDQVFEGLVNFDTQYKPVPWLADSWDISADGLTYTFHLHNGVKFQDGTDFNAQAMKFSMDRIRNNKASVGQSDCGPNVVADTQAVDDLTFKVTSAQFLTKLGTQAAHCGAAVSPTAVQKQGDDAFGQHPVGTGPFKFQEWQPGDHMTVVKSDTYWRTGADGKPLPYLDKINWRVISDNTQRLQALLTGEVDSAPSTSIADKDIASVKANSSLIFQQGPGLGWAGFMLNVSKPPFNNKALAQAVNFATNRDEVNSVVYSNLRERQDTGVIPAALGWAVDPSYKPYTYDPAQAKAKLAEGGQPSGFSFTILLDASNAQQEQLVELLQSEYKQVGIDMKIQSGDFNSVVVKSALSGDFQAVVLTVGGGGVDPDSWIYTTFHTDPNNPIASFNAPHLSDPQIDQLAEQGRLETDINKRAAIYKQANKLIMDYSPWIIVNNIPSRYIGNKKVQGYYVGQKATAGYAEFWKTSD